MGVVALPLVARDLGDRPYILRRDLVGGDRDRSVRVLARLYHRVPPPSFTGRVEGSSFSCLRLPTPRPRPRPLHSRRRTRQPGAPCDRCPVGGRRTSRR